MKKERYEKAIFVFIIIFLPLILFLMGLLLQGEKQIVASENRTATVFNDLLKTKYSEGEFQNELEDFLLDQFPFSEKLKITKNKIDNKLSDTFRKNIVKQKCEVGRYEIRNGVYNLFCEDYLVAEELSYEFAESELVKTQESLMGYDFTNALYCAYFVNDSKTLKDTDLKSNEQIYEIFKYDFESLGIKTEEFKINSLKDYLENFYKTDHHWNIHGAHRGYLEILALIGEEDRTDISGTKIVDGSFNGSYSRQIGLYNKDDKFEVFTYDYDGLEIYINNQKSNYGIENDFEEDKFDEYTNFYGAIFGGDYGEIRFINNNDNVSNKLLVISNSISNPINKMLANCFKETYVVDLRHFENDLGHKFKLEEYVMEHNIDKVLLLGNIDFFISLRDLMRYEE